MAVTVASPDPVTVAFTSVIAAFLAAVIAFVAVVVADVAAELTADIEVACCAVTALVAVV